MNHQTLSELPTVAQKLLIQVHQSQTPLVITDQDAVIATIYPTFRPSFGVMKDSGVIHGDLISLDTTTDWDVLQ